MKAEERIGHGVRRCSGYCDSRLPTGRDATYVVIEPAGQLRVFCDSDCLRFFYLDHFRAFLRREGIPGDGCLCDPPGEAGRRQRGVPEGSGEP